MLEEFDDDLNKSIEEANKKGENLEQLEELVQGTRAWHKMRMGLFSGSKFPALMTGGRAKGQEWGESSMGIIRQVYLERDLTDVGADLYIEELMAKEFRQTAWGKKYEPFARNAYEEETGDVVLETGFMVHKNFPNIGGSFDGAIYGENKIVEIKCPYDPLIHMANFEAKEITEKHKYYAQIQGNIEISGADSCDFVSFDPRRRSDSIAIINVPRDQEFIDRLMERIAIAERSVYYMSAGLSCEDAIILSTNEIRDSK